MSVGKVEISSFQVKSRHNIPHFQGFHSNIVNALEDLKSDETFVDVTLSCEGETIQVDINYSVESTKHLNGII